MPDRRKNQKKAGTPPPETGDFEVRDPAESSVPELLHSMIKSFMDSVVTSINVHIDGVIKDVTWMRHMDIYIYTFHMEVPAPPPPPPATQIRFIQ